MKDYKEDELLMLSGIQHYEFCKRQWALIHIEQQWLENYFTIDGNFMHKKVHDSSNYEKRKDTIISRGMAIHSFELGISGICDVVEFQKDKNGISIHGREDKYKVIPVEYKRGKPKITDADELQLAAQAMCLEEMFCCDIPKGYLFYGETKRRTEVVITEEMREHLRKITGEMHEMYNRKHTPKGKKTRACSSCSLCDVCLPAITKQEDVSVYIDQMLGR